MNRNLAHSKNKIGEEEFMSTHLIAVAKRAAEYAKAFDAEEEAYIAGLLHDIGKYGILFQKLLRGSEKKIDHWSQGAYIALEKYGKEGVASAIAIHGHHLGLKQLSEQFLKDINPEKLNDYHPEGLRLSEANTRILEKHFVEDGFSFPEKLSKSVYDCKTDYRVAKMLDVRMLYSALVDADFVETEAHFNASSFGKKEYRKAGIGLEPEKALEKLMKYVDALEKNASSSDVIASVRKYLFRKCLEAGKQPVGIYNLTAPTGSGKTLSMMAFALENAIANDLRRIIIVAPYLSIIEQTADVYRDVFKNCTLSYEEEQFILEDHSMANTMEDDSDEKGDSEINNIRKTKRLLSENWDAPLIITTSVQCLESMFSNRPSACRKLHRLANSVVLFDEIQTLPLDLAIPTISALSHLSNRYGSTVLFSTATQPAFDDLDRFAKKLCVHGWKPKEIVPDTLCLFEKTCEIDIEWPDSPEGVSWSELAQNVIDGDYLQVLLIVNLKKHAYLLFKEFKKRGAASIFHLSTNMCPAHRRRVLAEVKKLQSSGMPCVLVSTQCVEAGVDIDFPVVYRAKAPLDSIAQAAGRCNRNGLFGKGIIKVFEPESAVNSKAFPDASYERATRIAGIVIKSHSHEEVSLKNLDLFRDYYKLLYDFSKPENMKEALQNAIRGMDFEEVSNEYRLIRENAVNVLVPYNKETFNKLRKEAESVLINAKWVREARPYSISIFRPREKDPVYKYLLPAKFKWDKQSENWFIYLNEDHYKDDVGFNPQFETDCIIA